MTNLPDAPRTYHYVKGEGEAAVKILATRAKEKGVEIELGTPVQRILKTGNRISGVLVERDGQEREVAAKVVVIGSGGYANNKEWIKKYAGFDLDVNLFPIGNVGKMGDGIRMAFEVGAAEEGLGVLELFSAGAAVGQGFVRRNHLELAVGQPDLWLDPRGARFCDESVTFYDTPQGNVNARYKEEGYTYRLFDQSILQVLLEKGIEKQLGQDNPPGTRLIDFDRELNAALERGETDVAVADSAEELAEKMGVDKGVLKAAIDEYNSFCEKGHDDLFAKNPKYLRPLKGPRFYAIKARTLFLGTLGGIKINHKCEVVDKKGDIIPGLYAGGFDAGGMWGDGYCMRQATGISVGFATNSGRILGKGALVYIGK